MKIKKLFFTVIFLSLFLFIKLDNLIPLSSCTKGRISQYNNWQNGGTCGLGSYKNIVGSSYLYPVAINEDFFGNNAQCGVCYEMVGPIGAIKVRVEDYCPKNNELGYCSGDIFHFNIENNSISYIFGNETLSNISFRMISCDYSENIQILTSANTVNGYLLFVILNHNLAVSFIEIKEYNSQKWEKFSRYKNNTWEYYNSQSGIITYPIVIRIYSINGDYVNLTLSGVESNKYYEADGNFIIPNKTYFNISTLQKIDNAPNNDDLNKCCELDKSDFTPIYKDGNLNKNYRNYSQNVQISYNSEEKYLDKYSLKANLQSNGNLIFKSNFPIRADQFLGISFSMKSSKICENCLYFRVYNLTNNNQIISFNNANTWRNYSYSFQDLGIQNNEFNGIIINYNKVSNENLEINIENIQLIPNPYAPYAGICYNESKNNSYIEIPIHEETYLNNTDLIYINSININENSPNILNINCERFIYNGSKKIVLKFKSKDNNFDVDKCTVTNSNPISSFNCTLPNNLPDGIYNINSNSSNGFNIKFSKNIEIKKGYIICGNENIDSTMSLFSNVYYSPLIIIYSKEEIINKGDTVTFNIYPIPQEEYNLENDEIILLNNNGDFSLYLKYCHPNIKNKTIFSISCTVSNNVMIANYTRLYSNQIVSLLDGQRINLISMNPNGGIIKNNYTHIVESYLSKEEKAKYNLTFNVLYYNSNIRPGSEFPHKIYLYGVKKYSNLRKLEDTYNYQIILSNCSVGDYSTEYSNAIAFINCKMPDFVPAGTYTKIESDGIDINPQNSIYLRLDQDFNKSSSSLNNFNYNRNATDDYDDDDDEKSSSSGIKEWIIWVIVVILVIVLVVLVIIIMACKNNDNEEISKLENSKSPVNNNTTSD